MNAPRTIELWKALKTKISKVSKNKDECQVWLIGKEHNYWMGTEIGMLGSYEFQGWVTACDWLDKIGNLVQEQDFIGWEEKGKSRSAKWDVRKRAPAQIDLNQQHFYWRLVTRWYGAVAVFVWQSVIVEDRQYRVDCWMWKDNVGGGTCQWYRYSNRSHRDITNEDCRGDINLLG